MSKLRGLKRGLFFLSKSNTARGSFFLVDNSPPLPVPHSGQKTSFLSTACQMSNVSPSVVFLKSLDENSSTSPLLLLSNCFRKIFKFLPASHPKNQRWSYLSQKILKFPPCIEMVTQILSLSIYRLLDYNLDLLFFKEDFIYLFLEREQRKEKEKERNIDVQSVASQTGNLSVRRLVPRPLSHTSRG